MVPCFDYEAGHVLLDEGRRTSEIAEAAFLGTRRT